MSLVEVLLHLIAQFHRDSYENCSDDEDIVSCEWTKELFIKSSYPTTIKRVEENYEALYGIEKGGMTCLNIDLDEMFNISDVVINSLQQFFKNFTWNGVAKYPSENVAHIFQQVKMFHLFSRISTLWKSGWQRYWNFQGIRRFSYLLGSPSVVCLSLLVHLN